MEVGFWIRVLSVVYDDEQWFIATSLVADRPGREWVESNLQSALRKSMLLETARFFYERVIEDKLTIRTVKKSPYRSGSILSHAALHHIGYCTHNPTRGAACPRFTPESGRWPRLNISCLSQCRVNLACGTLIWMSGSKISLPFGRVLHAWCLW